MPEPRETRRLLADTLAGAVAQFGALAVAFVLAPLPIRAFGEGPYGAYVLATSVASLLLLLPAALAWAARAGGFTTSLKGTLLTFAMAALLYWMAFLVLMVSRAERDGLIATARVLMTGRSVATR